MNNRKPWMAAILSTALLFSGALTLAPKAFADDDDYPAIERVKAPLDRQQYITDRLNKLINMTISFSEKESTDIYDALLHGQNLAQASGLDSSLLAAKLGASIDQDLANTLQNYTVTNEQLIALKSDLYNGIQIAISTPGYKSPSDQNRFNYGALMDKYISQLKADALILSEEDYMDIQDRLIQGGSLVEATRLNQQFLTNALITPIVQDIDKAAQENLLTASEAADLKVQANKTIASAISTPYNDHNQNNSKLDIQAFINKHLASIFNDAYLVVNTDDLEYNELKNAYKQGGSLTSLTATSADELASRILNLWSSDMQAVSDHLSAQDSTDFLQKVTDAIKAAVNAAGK
ncbi:hypothetical protein [Paenibacillus periandrae]|uniref:hypothetical protein n=1 Tax=Paenibacillus periandrae TaxID=1761741 RepID=UPI001F09ED01|nr:hypothetical protein [Paenibacillus periandrae]